MPSTHARHTCEQRKSPLPNHETSLFTFLQLFPFLLRSSAFQFLLFLLGFLLPPLLFLFFGFLLDLLLAFLAFLSFLFLFVLLREEGVTAHMTVTNNKDTCKQVLFITFKSPDNKLI